MLKSNVLVTMIGGAVVAGCTKCPIQRLGNQPPDPVNDTPVIVDDAMQIRDWDRSVAYYQNGDTIAYPTGFLYEPTWYQPEWYYYFIETPLFIGQTIAMPVVMVITPPWTPVRYTGVTIEPTYTAMPPLPPSVAISEAPPVEPAPVVPALPLVPATQPS